MLTDYIIFNTYIKPICIHRTLRESERVVQTGWLGHVAGWGLTASGGTSSPELKIIDLPTFDIYDCRNRSTVEYRPLITEDKFCAGLTTGEIIISKL